MKVCCCCTHAYERMGELLFWHARVRAKSPLPYWRTHAYERNANARIMCTHAYERIIDFRRGARTRASDGDTAPKRGAKALETER